MSAVYGVWGGMVFHQYSPLRGFYLKWRDWRTCTHLTGQRIKSTANTPQSLYTWRCRTKFPGGRGVSRFSCQSAAN
uniref:Uncharacterized protein n=1 Tax=Anguilla anguilla TaxID=7936 RepID=A0A0E9VLF4_ANGAN